MHHIILILALAATVPDPPAPPKPAAAAPASAPKPEAPKRPPTATYPVHGGNVFVVGIPLQVNGRVNHQGMVDALTTALAVAVVQRENADAKYREFLALESKAAEDAQKPPPHAKPAKGKK